MFDENSNAAVASGASVTATTPSLSAGVPSAAGASVTPNTAIVSQLLNVKDSRWLQVEVCREFQRGQCSRTEHECKFAHPPPHVDVQQGRVTACYDSIKGRCTRENPKCKYLHPPQHIKDQLLINGRNNLALKNLISAQLNQSAPPLVNSLQSLQQMQLHQQQSLAAANMIPTLPYPYYQGVMYPAAMLQADPYQQAVTQQLQAAALLQQSGLLSSGAAAGANLLTTATPQLTLVGGGAHSAAAVAASAAAAAASRKRTLDDDAAAQTPFLNFAAAVSAAAAAGVPCKRPAVDKNGAVVYQTAAAAGQPGAAPAATFNPYLLQSLQGYVPAVSFASGQVPPRY